MACFITFDGIPWLRFYSVRSLLCFMLIIFGSGCSHLLYYPSQKKRAEPEQMGLHATNVWIDTSDGVRVHGWYFDPDSLSKKNLKEPEKDLTIVFFHGNGENMTTHFASLAWTVPYGYSYLVIDYRGYYKSEGQPSPKGTLLDAKAALRWAHQNHPQDKLVVYGESLGGAVALRAVAEYQEQYPVDLIVVNSAFHSYEGIVKNVLSKSWLTWLFQPLAYVLFDDTYAPKGHLHEISSTPLVVMHGTQDQTVAYELGREVFKKAKEPKSFWKIKDGRHIDAFWRHGKKYRQKFLDRLEQLNPDSSTR